MQLPTIWIWKWFRWHKTIVNHCTSSINNRHSQYLWVKKMLETIITITFIWKAPSSHNVMGWDKVFIRSESSTLGSETSQFSTPMLWICRRSHWPPWDQDNTKKNHGANNGFYFFYFHLLQQFSFGPKESIQFLVILIVAYLQGPHEGFSWSWRRHVRWYKSIQSLWVLRHQGFLQHWIIHIFLDTASALGFFGASPDCFVF